MVCQPQAIVFDLYETLVTHYDPDWTPGPTVAERLGLDEEAFSKAWKETSPRAMSGAIPDYPSRLGEIVSSLGHVPNDALFQQLYKERLAAHERPFIQVEADVIEMLRELEATSVKVGLISNATGEEVVAWDSCVLAPFFDDVVFSYRLGLIKPDRRIYHLACEHLGVSPESTLFVGDGGSSELAGAAGAGLTPYWATWFLERWPGWEASAESRNPAARFPRLTSPSEVVSLLKGKNGA